MYIISSLFPLNASYQLSSFSFLIQYEILKSIYIYEAKGHTLLKAIETETILSNSLYEPEITLIPQTERDI